MLTSKRTVDSIAITYHVTGILLVTSLAEVSGSIAMELRNTATEIALPVNEFFPMLGALEIASFIRLQSTSLTLEVLFSLGLSYLVSLAVNHASKVRLLAL